MYKMPLILILCILSQISHAIDHSKSEAGIQLYFANGMFNTKKDAQKSLDKIKRDIGEKYKDEEVDYHLAFNQNEMAHIQILQVIEQKFMDTASLFWGMWSGLATPSEEFSADMLNISNAISNSPFSFIDLNAGKHLTKYADQIKRCHKVIVVGHSQGNFYANTARNLLLDERYKKALKVISVATPASYVSGNGPHTTLFEDLIITSIPFSLPANVNNSSSYKKTIGSHYFVESYMKSESSSRAKITSDIHNALDQLEPMCSYENCGKIKSSFFGNMSFEFAAGSSLSTVCNGKGNGEIEVDAPFKYSRPTNFIRNEQYSHGTDKRYFKVAIAKNYGINPAYPFWSYTHYGVTVVGDKIFCQDNEPNVLIYALGNVWGFLKSSDEEELLNKTYDEGPSQGDYTHRPRGDWEEFFILHENRVPSSRDALVDDYRSVWMPSNLSSIELKMFVNSIFGGPNSMGYKKWEIVSNIPNIVFDGALLDEVDVQSMAFDNKDQARCKVPIQEE